MNRPAAFHLFGVTVLPRFSVRLHSQGTRKDTTMAQLMTLMNRFGLFAPKAEQVDMFAMRLDRITAREARARNQRQSFKNQSSHSEDAVLS
jgi:hypothetical protein